jgi:predicted RNase H-like HicB family nuclease
MEKYLIVVEKSQTGYSVYSPDVLGCVATGNTIDGAIDNMKAAMVTHLQTMVEDGEKIPTPKGLQSYLDAERDSEGEEYFITHVAIESVLPQDALI